MSQSTPPVPTEPAPVARESVTTAAGIAAERALLADRERRTTQARLAARRLDRSVSQSKGPGTKGAS